MAAKIICMASAKGGSGKTVLTATFAAFITSLGKRVLMVDTDAATNGLTLMFFKETRMRAELAASQRTVPRGIFEALAPTRHELVTTSIGVDLIPATYAFINTERVPVDHFRASLEGALLSYSDDYDFIFLDAQAGADHIAYIAMSQNYSDRVILVSEYDPLSAAGIERLKGLFREDLTYVRTWILLNKMLPDFVRSFSDFMEVAKYASPIPWDADVVRAYARRRLALDFENGNEFTLAIVQSLRSIFSEELDREIEDWLKSKVTALREPIETQYHDLEEELKSLLFQRAKTRSRGAIARLSVNGVLLIGVPPLVITLFSFLSEKALHLDIPHDTRASSFLIPSIVVGVSVVLWTSWTHLSDPRKDVDSELLERQVKLLQERLEKLEALRTANVETLVRQRIAG